MANEEKGLSKVQAAVLGAFAANAYGMQYEWIYDISQIKLPLNEALGDAGSKFLNGKKAGDFDMYGDQLLATLRSIAVTKKFDAPDYIKHFQAVFSDSYVGWKPSVVKHALGELAKGTPLNQIGAADHDDNNAYGQFVPLLLVYHDKAAFVAAAQEYTSLTFRGPRSLKFANFFSNVLWAVKEGQSPSQALKAVVATAPFHGDKHIEDLVHKGIASAARDTTEVVKEFGQACDSNGGFPVAVHLLSKYENDFHKAIQANAAAGGDSTGRGLIVGAAIALHHGSKVLPAYTKDIKAHDEITKLLHSI